MVFKLGEPTLDHVMLRFGAVHLFHKMDVYEHALNEFRKLEYNLIRLPFKDMETFQSDVTSAFKWRLQFGYAPWTGNLNQLNDAFIGEPFNSSDRSALCIENYEALAAADKDLSFWFLDLVERYSRYYLLYGKKLVALIQTNDPKFHCEGIGANSARWNFAESIEARRGK